MGESVKIVYNDPVEHGCIDILRAEGPDVDSPPGLPVEELNTITGACDGLVVRSVTKVACGARQRRELAR